MIRKFKDKRDSELVIEYEYDSHNKIFYKRSNFPQPDIKWITTNWKSWKQIEDWTYNNGWIEVKELITEVDYLNAFKENFKYGG